MPETADNLKMRNRLRLTIISDFKGMRHFLPFMLPAFASLGYDVRGLDYGELTLRDHECSLLKDYSPAIVRKTRHIPKLRNLFKWFYPITLKRMIKDNGKSDVTIVFFVHKYAVVNSEMIRKYADKVIVLFAGSDFYRASNNTRNRQARLLDLADDIVCITSTFKENLVSYFGNSYNDKVSVSSLWLPVLDLFPARSDAISGFCSRYKIHEDAVVVAIGYNGKRAQQHLRIIESISGIQPKMLNIFIIIQATYGLTNEYKNEINMALNKLGYDFLIIDQVMTIEDIVSFRTRCDIVINMQTSDMSSGSLIEHHAGGGVLIVGDWLPYGHLKDKGLFFHETGFGTLGDLIKECVNELEVKKQKAKCNCGIVMSNYRRESVLPRWQKLFRGYEC